MGSMLTSASDDLNLRANLATTQRYLGKITDVEAARWIENLYS
jgi:2,3-bisphosphoglycerate-independent phosphoglycerate mutase